MKPSEDDVRRAERATEPYHSNEESGYELEARIAGEFATVRAEERAKIVACLRHGKFADHEEAPPRGYTCTCRHCMEPETLRECADAIERGDHER